MVTFWPMALFTVTDSAVGVSVVLVVVKVVVKVAVGMVVRALVCAVEIAVIARISAAGNTVVAIMATAAALPVASSPVVAFSVVTGTPGKKPASGCSQRRNTPSKSSRQTIATMRARRGVTTNEGRPTT